MGKADDDLAGDGAVAGASITGNRQGPRGAANWPLQEVRLRLPVPPRRRRRGRVSREGYRSVRMKPLSSDLTRLLASIF